MDNILYAFCCFCRAEAAKYTHSSSQASSRKKGQIRYDCGEECLIYTCNSNATVTGTIRSYNDGWIEIETKGQCDILNCEYITRIREYPRGKNGKRKNLVLD